MNAVSLCRYDGNYASDPGPANTTLHFYPFDQLPVLQSHVYPHYVIYDLGKKLDHFFGEDLDQEPIPHLSFEMWVKGLHSFYNLEMCHRLYRSWMMVIPPTWYIQGKDSDDNAPDGNGGVEDTSRSDTGSRATRSKSNSEAHGEDGNRGGGKDGAAVDNVPKSSEDDTFYIDPIDNVVFPSDSVSCRDGLTRQGDAARCDNGEYGGDSDCGLSDTSWIDDLQSWRVKVHTAIDDTSWLEGEADVSKMPMSASSNASFSESSTAFDSAVVGSVLDKSCGGCVGIKQEGARVIAESEAEIHCGLFRINVDGFDGPMSPILQPVC
jgi:hypothetical protein